MIAGTDAREAGLSRATAARRGVAADPARTPRPSSRTLKAGGGTAIGAWLTRGRQLFAGRTRARSATRSCSPTGENESETPEELDAAVRDVRGRVPVRLPRRRHRLGGRRAAQDRLGAARHASTSSAEPEDLAADFAAMIERGDGQADRPTSRCGCGPRRAPRSRFVKQVVADDRGPHRPAAPTSTTATATTRPARGATRPATTTSRSRCPRGEVGDEMLAGRVSLVVDGEVGLGSRWSGRSGPTTRRCRRGSTARSRTTPGRRELADAIQEGLEARRAGDDSTGDAQASAARSSSPPRSATTPPLQAAGARSSTSRTPRPARCGCKRDVDARTTRWRSTLARPRPFACSGRTS